MDTFQTRLLEEIDRNEQEMIQFLDQFIRVNSENLPGNEVEVSHLILSHMEHLGLKDVQVFKKEKLRPNLLFEMGGAHPDGLCTIFNGHIDTKPPGDLSMWHSVPRIPEYKDGRIYGLGTADMKGAVVAMIYAMYAIHSLGQEVPGRLKLWLTADEENGSQYGAKYLAEQELLKADYAIITEPCGIQEDWESLCIVSRGVCCFKVKVHGDQVHSSLTDRLDSVNANVQMAKVLVQFKDQLKLTYTEHPYCPDGPTVNPGVVVRGGISYGVNPGISEFCCDIRTIPGMTLEQTKHDVQTALLLMMQEDPTLKLELEWESPPLQWIAPTEIEEHTPPVTAIQNACQSILGRIPPSRTFTGGTDASFIQGLAGIPTIPAFGPGLLTEAHAPNESLSLKSLMEAAKIYAVVGWDLINQVKK